MSLEATIGKPGAGKSYDGVKQAAEALSLGRVVITSLPLNKKHPKFADKIASGDLILYPSSANVPEGETKHFGHIDGWNDIQANAQAYQREITAKGEESSKIGPLVIVDEGYNTFSDMVREKRKSKHYSTLLKFFTVHRHHLIDIVLLFQDHSQIDTEMKPLISRFHKVYNNTDLGLGNRYKILTYAKAFTTKSTPTISEGGGLFKKEIFAMYDSYSEGSGKNTKGKKKEAGLRKVRPVWLHWKFLLLGLALLAFPFALIKTITGISGVITKDEKTKNFGAPVPSNSSETNTNLPIKSARALLQWEPDPLVVLTELGWPQQVVPFIGFDSNNIYFENGRVLNRITDIRPNGVIIVSATACKITMFTSFGVAGEAVEVNYYCKRGY